MSDRRQKNVNWLVAEPDGNVPTCERCCLAVLMDIRDELQRLNTLLSCENFLRIPHDLQQIRRNTAKPRRKPAARKGKR